METKVINNRSLSICSFLHPVRVIDLQDSEEIVNPKVLFPNLKLDDGEFSGYEFTELRSENKDVPIGLVKDVIGLYCAAFTPAKLAYFIARAARTLVRGRIGTIFLLDRDGEISLVWVTSTMRSLSFQCTEIPIDDLKPIDEEEYQIYKRAVFVLPFKLELSF